MKTGDALKTGWAALADALTTDARCTEDEKAALVIIDDLLDAAGDTTKEQDLLVVSVMKRFVASNENYAT